MALRAFRSCEQSCSKSAKAVIISTLSCRLEILSNTLNLKLKIELLGAGDGSGEVDQGRRPVLRVFYATLGRKAANGPVGRAVLHCAEGLIS
jgi:hypothetical protein